LCCFVKRNINVQSHDIVMLQRSHTYTTSRARTRPNALHKFFQPDGFPAFGVGTHAEPMVPSWLGARDLQHCCLLCKNRSNTHGVIAQKAIFSIVPFTANTVCSSPEIFENMKVILRICAFMRGFRICTSIRLNHCPRRDNRRFVLKNSHFLHFFRFLIVPFTAITLCFEGQFHEGRSYASLNRPPCWEQNVVCPVLGGSRLREISRSIPNDPRFVERNSVPFTAITLLSMGLLKALLYMRLQYGARCWPSDNTDSSRLVVPRLRSVRTSRYMSCFQKNTQFANPSSGKHRNVLICSMILCNSSLAVQ